MSKALGVLKLFFSLVSINSTEVNQSTPQVVHPLDRTQVYTGSAFSIPIPSDTFYDKEDGDTTNLRLKMTTGDGKKLPRWIRLNQEKLEVYGFPLRGNAPYTFNFSMFAYDLQNASARADLIIQVKEPQFPHNHEVILTTEGLPYQDYMRDIDLRFNLAKKLARLVADRTADTLWVKHFDRAMTLKLVFRHVGYSPCDRDAINDLATKLEKLKHLTVEKRYRIRVSKVDVNLFGPCNPVADPEKAPAFSGWLKHVLPILILLAVVGIPVSISIVVRRSKARAARERRRRAGGKREEDTCFNYHTVHYNYNRYPSMLSVSNNSKEEGVVDDDSRRVAIHSGKTKNAQNTGASNLNQKVLKKPESTKKPIRSMREIMYDDDDDDESGEKVELNIPVYYNVRKGDVVEEESSIMDVNLSELAGNLSSRLMNIGKSVLNAQSAATERADDKLVEEPEDTVKPFVNQARAEGQISNSPSIPSKLVDFTKSVLNLSQDQTRTASETSNEPSALMKLRDFGKSMLNLTGGTEPPSKEDSSEGWEPYDYSDNETSHTNDWDDAHANVPYSGMYGTYDVEASEYDVPSHGDQSCYNFYDVTTDALEYSDSSWYTGETAETSVSSYPREAETSVVSYAQYDPRDVDMTELYRQKEEEASRFMRSFAVDPPASRQGEWDHSDNYSDRGYYHDYVNPYHPGDAHKSSFISRGWRRRSMETYSEGDYGLQRSQQELFVSMPDLGEQLPSRSRRESLQSGDRGGSFLGSLFSLKQQDKEASGSITGYIKTHVKGIMGQSDGSSSSWLFQKSDNPFS